VQAAVGECASNAPEGISQDSPRAGEVEESEQPQGPKWPEHGYYHYHQIGKVVYEELPALRREVGPGGGRRSRPAPLAAAAFADDLGK